MAHTSSKPLIGLFCAMCLVPRVCVGQESTAGRIVVDIPQTIERLLKDEDTDGDRKITLDDHPVPGTERGDKIFRLVLKNGEERTVRGTSFLSNLLQELKTAEESGGLLNLGRVYEKPADRISRMIRESFWDGLTRTIDEKGIRTMLKDTKIKTAGSFFLYVPASDKTAVRYYRDLAAAHPDWHLNVRQLPDPVPSEFVATLNGRHGLLSLALMKNGTEISGLPFVVPGGRFNEMYGWDSYFITLGLLHDGRIELARAMVDNFVYELDHYGAILNANRTYYLTRSQPPFLSSMIRAVAEHLPKTAETQAWLERAVNAAISEYENVWMGQDRLTSTGLSRYFDTGRGPAPEVAEYETVFRLFAGKWKMDPAEFEQQYREGRIRDPNLDEYFLHDRAMRESGHDTSNRLVNRCADLVTVDLNSLLYKIETDIRDLLKTRFNGIITRPKGGVSRAGEWNQKAEQRRRLINRYLWNEASGMYFDYNVATGERSDFVSPGTFYPLWAGVASPSQANRVVVSALALLEQAGGLAGSSRESRGTVDLDHPQRQWDYPFGWSPHQMIAWAGLLRYGFDQDAERLAYRWLYMITLNASNFNGTVPEKFDVVGRTHKVFAEYGNVGTSFAYITREGFGWTNASFQLGRDLLSHTRWRQLNDLIPPEIVFGAGEGK